MSYQAILEERNATSADREMARNMLEHMDYLRSINDPRVLKRWVWELLNNAKNSAFPGESILVEFELFEDRMLFTHNGKPFNIGNIMTLLQKVGDVHEFSGFSATCVLSERVRVTGIIQDFHIETGSRLPMKNFSLELDRSGTSQDEMVESVDKGIVSLMRLDSAVDVPGNFEDFKTVFTYALQSERSKKVAQLGMEELALSASYLMAFLPEIGMIRVVNHIKTTTTELRRGQEHKWTNPQLSVFALQVSENGVARQEHLLLGRQEKTVIALPVDEMESCFLPLSRDLSRFFAPFPVTHTQIFPLPFVCYDAEVQKKEGGELCEIGNSLLSHQTRDNGIICDIAMKLYENLLIEASERRYTNFYHVVYFPVLEQTVEADHTWVKTHIYEKIYHCLSNIPVFTTEKGMVPLDSTLVFPASIDRDELTGLWHILNVLPHVSLPVLEESVGWCQAFLPYDDLMKNRMMTLEVLLANIHLFTWKDRSLKLEFVQQVFDCVAKNPNLRGLLASGELAIFPDQTLEMNLHKSSDIYVDPGLSEAIKQGILELNHVHALGNEENYLVYNLLLHPGFDLGDFTEVHEAPLDLFFDYMSEKTWVDPDLLGEEELAHLELAVGCFMSCYWDDFWLQMYQKFVNPSLTLPHVPSGLGKQEDWNNSISLIIHKVATLAQESKNMAQFGESYFTGASPRVVERYLCDFVDKAGEISENIYEYAIFPNQYGDFCLAKDLSNDFGIDEELKVITRLLHHENVPDYYSILFAQYFSTVKYHLVMPKNNESIAQDILRGVNRIFNNKKLVDAENDTKEACILLLSWMEDHDDMAEALFSQFSGEENRMKLITPKSAGYLSKKVGEYDALMLEYGIVNVAELEELLKRTKELVPPKPAFVYEEMDVFVDFHEYAVLQNLTLEEREAYVEKVREAGMKCALSYLMKKWESLGFHRLTAVEEGKFVLENLDNKVVIQRFSREKQKGWHICETVNESPSVYYGVKTTVSQENREQMQLSEAQLNLAFLLGDNFRIFRYLLTADLKKVIASKQILNLVDDLQGDQVKFVGEQFHFTCPYKDEE